MDDSSENSLKNRLYMNFSHKSLIHRQPFLQDQSKQLQKLSTEVLVPKIYADSHRKSNGLERSMASIRGKIVLDKQQWHPKGSEKKRSVPLAVKEPMNPIEQNELTEEGRALAKKQKGLHKKQRFNKELVMNLAPRNIFSFFESYPDMHLDFFYLNKYSHPYDYRIVEFNERNPDEYMTISCKGVTQFIQKEAYFMSRQEWMAEQDMYYKLQTIDFFCKYKLNKNFRIWKNMMKRHYMKEMSNLLNEKLFAASNSQAALLSIKHHCLELEDECKIIAYETHPPYTIEEFEGQVAKHQKEVFLKSVRRFEKKIVEELVLSIQQSVEAYKQENNLVDRKDSEKGEEPRKDRLDYSKEALLRMHYVKIARFIKLVDAMLLEAKTSMMQNNLQQLLDVLTNINSECKDDWLLCRADWNGYIITWTPDRNHIKDSFAEISNNALKLLYDEKFSLEQQPEFKLYRTEDDKHDSKKEQRATIKDMCKISDDYNRRRSEISEQLDVACDRVEDEQLKVMEFANIYERHQHQNIELDGLSVYEVRKTIGEYCDEDLRMEAMPERVELGLLLLDFSQLRKRMKHAPAKSRARLFEMLPRLLENKSCKLGSRIQEFSTELAQPPAKVENFVTYTKSVNRASECLDELSSSSAELSELMCLMEQLKLPGLEKYRQKVKSISSSVALLKEQIQKSNASYDRNLGNFRKELDSKIKSCEATLKLLQERYAEVPLCHRDSDIDSMIQFLESVKPQVGLLSQQASEVNYLEAELNLQKTPFDKISSFHLQFSLVEQLWLGRRQWRDMVRDIRDRHFMQVNHVQLRSQYEQAIRVSCMLLKELETNEVTKVFYDEVLTFELVISTLAALHDPHLRQKQEWEEIPRFLYRSKYPDCDEDEVDPQKLPLANVSNPIYTVSWIISQEIYLYREQLSYFGTKAARQEELASTLKGIKTYLHQAQLILVNCTDGKEGTVLGNNEKLFAEVDEKLIVLNNIMASKYVQNLRLKVETLVKQFRYLQELFDEMLLHQQNWLYLQPLLSSTSYSSKSLTKESKEFLGCDSAWRRVAKMIRDNPSLKKLADDMTTGCYIRRTLSKNNTSFEQIKKLLEDYIERKRSYFPRFYFLSNQKVLDILSKTKSPKALEPYLPLLFQQVRGFVHDREQSVGVTGVINKSDEQLLFKQFALRPQAEAEEILKAVEEQIKKNLSSVMRSTLPRYEQESISRMQLIEQFPYQVASITDWILWSKLTEQYLDPDCQSDIGEWADLQVQQVAELAAKLRTDRRPTNRRQTLSCMVLQSIYMRERTQLLQRKNTTSVGDYCWLSAIKFCIGGSGGLPEIYMKQFNGRLPYGFEFQCIPQTLVITPETERAWLGFHMAFEQRLFPNVHGKCSSGKTQTIKQLAGLLAENYIENNCSDLTNTKSLERVLLGGVVTGSWIAFNQWQRIRPEVLSVIAGHFFNVRRALVEGKDNMYLLKGSVMISPAMNVVFPNSNESLISRGCLAGLMRSIMIVTPPIKLVARGLLQGYGFEQIEQLTDYFARLMDYCKTVLSVYCQYNFSLKSVRSIIEAMNRLSVNEKGAEAEESLFCEAVRQVIGLNLDNETKEHLNTFVGLLVGSFGSAPILHQEDAFNSKVEELIKSVSAKAAVIVVGGSLEGKTTVIRESAKRSDSTVYMVNHGCYSLSELFGESEGTSGILPLLFKNSMSSWIVLDGAIGRTVNDQFGLLQSCMAINCANPSAKLLFETDSLAEATPSLLSRTNIVTVHGINTIELLIDSQLNEKLTAIVPIEILKALSQLLATALKKLLTPKKQFSLALKMTELAVARTCCNNLSLLFEQNSIKLAEKDLKESRKIVDKLGAWAVTWSLGCFVFPETFTKFEAALNEVFKLDNLPPGGVLHHTLTSSLEWAAWQSQLPNQLLNPNEPFEDVMIWTSEAYCCSTFIRGNIQQKTELMIIGQTGTGKSKIVRSVINYLSKEENSLNKLCMTLSSNSKATTIQALLEERLQNQRRNGQIVTMPPPGKKLLIQIDDLSLNSCSEPALEILRQQISHHGMFDRCSFGWKATQDIAVGVIARQPSTQTVRCPRFLNLFSLFLLKEDDEILSGIFVGLLKTWLRQSSFNDELSRTLSSGRLVEATLNVYRLCSKQLRSKPNDCLYLLNYSPRDVFKVFQSISRIDCTNYTKMQQIARLWSNEVLRVFSDRLATKTRKQQLHEYIRNQLFVMFKYDVPDAFFKQPMLYGTGIDSESYIYLNYESTCLNLREKMIELSPKFSLLLFKELVEHIVHIVRGLGVRYGHFLLIGPRASGKKSIVQLACFVAKINCELELQGQSKLSKCFISAVEGVPTCLFINQRSLATVEQLHQLNCIFNRTICPFENSKELAEKISGLPSENRNQSLTDMFFDAVYQQLHVVIAASPSDSLKNLLLENPQIVTSCTIDFMNRWPDEALYEVAEINMSDDIFHKDQKFKLSRVASLFHRAVESVIEGHKLSVLLSPRRYLELISLFSFKYQVRSEESTYIIGKLKKCIDKYSQIVASWEEEKKSLLSLEDLIKSIAANQEEVTQKIEQSKIALTECEPDTDGNEQQRQAQLQLVTYSDRRKILNQNLKVHCEKVSSIDRKEFSALRCGTNEIAIVRDSLSKLLCTTPSNTTDTAIDIILMQKLKTLQFTALQSDEVNHLEVAVNCYFASKRQVQASNLIGWVKDMCDIVKELTEVNLKQKNLIESSSKSVLAPRTLLAFEISGLEMNLASIRHTRSIVDTEIKQTREKIRLGKELQDRLSEEHQSWEIRLKSETAKLDTLLYDLFFTCSSFSYLGSFDSQHREQISDLWKGILETEGVPFCRLDFADTLFDELEIESLKMFTNENLLSCLMMIKSPATPYLIDPDEVATNYLRSIYPQIRCLRYGDENFLRLLEKYVQEGAAVLLEYNQPTIDASLQPLLEKTSFTGSGNKRIIKLTDKPIECHDSFKLFLCNRWREVAFTNDIHDNCCVINFNLTKRSVAELFQTELLELLAAHEQRIIEEETSKASDVSISLKAISEKILSLIENVNFQKDSANARDVLDELKKVEEKKAQLELELAGQKCRVAELTASHANLKQLAHWLSELAWFSFSELRSVNSVSSYQLINFKAAVKTSVLSYLEEQPSTEDVKLENYIISKVSRILNKELSRSAKQGDQTILRLLILLRVETILSGAQSYNDFVELFTNYSASLPSDITSLLSNLKVCGLFNDLIDKFEGDQDFHTWLATSDFTQSETMYGPIVISPVQRLYLLKATLPSTQFVATADQLTLKYFGGDDSLNMAGALLSLCNNRTPLCLICSDCDPIIDILTLARQRKMSKDSVAIVHLNLEDRQTLEKGIESTAWLVLTGVEEKTIQLVQRLYDMIQANEQLREDFRLILVINRASRNNRLTELMKGKHIALSQEHLPSRFVFNSLQKTKKDVEMGQKSFEQISQNLAEFYQKIVCSQPTPREENVLQAVTDTLNLMTALPDMLSLPSIKSTILDLLEYESNDELASYRSILDQCFQGKESTESNGECQQDLLEHNKSNYKTTNCRYPLWNCDCEQEITCLTSKERFAPSQISSLIAQIPNPIINNGWQASDPVQSYLHRQCSRYNALLGSMRDDLLRVLRYMECTVCEQCEQAQHTLQCLQRNQVPDTWHSQYILQKKAFHLWFEELRKNFEVLKRWWIKEERPRFTNISMLFYPACFLQTVLIKWAKKTKLRIENACFSYKLMTNPEGEPPSNEFIINLADIYLKGCRYEPVKNFIEEFHEEENEFKVGITQLIPIEMQRPPITQAQVWSIRVPIYRAQCKGSGELVCFIEVNTKKKPDSYSHHRVSGYCQRTDLDRS